MTFVYPILLGGMIFAGLPVLLHFLIRQKPRTLPFPAFRFLMMKQRTNTRNLRLRHLLLMLLRIALLVLLCLALSRPRLFQEQIGLSRERPVALILVFDTSPSMEYKHSEMTRLELAKRRSLELLDELPEDCRILIIDSAEPSGNEEWLKSLSIARQKINGLTIHGQATPVTSALEAALAFFKKWEGQDDPASRSYPRFLCVFSDRTLPCWDRSKTASLQKELEREADNKIQPLFFDVGIDDPVDLAVTQLELPRTPDGLVRQAFAEGEKILLRAVVKGTGKRVNNTLICQLGTHKLQQAFDVQANSEQAVTFEIDTGDWKLGPGFHQVELKLETATDALSFNNQRFVTFKIRPQQPVLVLVDDVNKSKAFPNALKAWLYDAKVRSVNDKSDLGLDAYSAVFLDGVAAPSDKLWEELADYVQKGGGLGIIPDGDDLQPAAYNSAAAKKIMPARIKEKIASPQGSTWDLFSADLLHPFLRSYGNWRDNGSYDLIRNPRRAYQYWDVHPYQEKDVLVRYEEGSRPAVVERSAQKPAGKVLLLTTPLEEQKSRWNNYLESANSFYVGLTMLCTQYLCKEAELPRLNFVFGPQMPQVRLPFDKVSAKYVLNGPDFSEEIRFDDKANWSSDRLPRAGNYILQGTDAEKQNAKIIEKFSLNVSREESDLRRVPVEDIEAALGKQAVIPQDRNKSLLDSLPAQFWNEPMELFPWLMVLLLFILALENLLANRFYRQT